MINGKRTLVSGGYSSVEDACRELEVGLSEGGGPPFPLLFAVWQDALGEYHFGLPHQLNSRFLGLFSVFGNDGYSAIRHMGEASEVYGGALFEEVPGPDEGLLGIGMFAEAVRISLRGDETREEMLARVEDKDQVHCVFVHLMCRDGSTHMVEHEVNGSQDYFYSPNGETGMAGPMAVGLVNFLNSIVPEDVPVPDYDFDSPQGWWHGS